MLRMPGGAGLRCVGGLRAWAAACAAGLLGACPGVGLAQTGGGHQEVVAVAPGAASTSTPVCSGVETFILQPFAGTLYTVLRVDAVNGGATAVGLWSEESATLVQDDRACAVGDKTGTVDWLVSTGTLHLTGESPRPAGMVRSEVALSGPGGSVSFMVGSVMPQPPSSQTETTVAEAITIVEVEPGEDPPGTGPGDVASIGSSCTCPRCATGEQFWVPFFVIGVGNVPGGRMCCGLACGIACARLAAGMPEQEAWAVGQGTWVLCMLCQ